MPALTVTFAFSPKQRVTTPWGDMGIIDDAAVNAEGGRQYFVQRSQHSQWFSEDQLTALATDAPVPVPPPYVPPGPVDPPLTTDGGAPDEPPNQVIVDGALMRPGDAAEQAKE